MSVSSIASSGLATSDTSRSATPPRTNAAPAQDAADPAASATPQQAGKPLGQAAPTPHANRLGVAAYISIMNPAPAVSVRTEA